MRIRIHLLPEQISCDLPLDYHYPLASLIYNTMAIISPDYASFLHEEGYGADANLNLINQFSGSSQSPERQVVQPVQVSGITSVSSCLSFPGLIRPVRE